MIKKLFSDTAIYAIGPQMPKLVSFLLLPILTKYLTPEDYGVNGIILAYVGAFEAFKDLGLSIILTNTFFKYPNRYLFTWKRVHGFVQSWTPIYGLLLVPLIMFITPSDVREDIGWIIFCIVIPIMFFQPVATVGSLYFQLQKKPKSFVLIALLSSLTAILVNYITIVHMRMGYLGFLFGTFTASLVAFISYIYLVYFKIKLFPSVRFSYKWIKRNLSISLPTIPHFYAGYILGVSDRVLLNFFKISVNEIGLYSFAYGIGTYFSILGKSLQKASGPYYMEFYKLENTEGDKKARDISYIMQAGLLLSAFLISLWMKELFSFIARNEELKSSYYLAIIILMSYTYYPSYLNVGMKMWYLEKTKRIMKISVVAAIISISLNLILIPNFGIVGAAVTTFLSFMFMGFGGYLYPSIRKELKVNYYAINWFIIILTATMISLYLKDSNIMIKGGISFILLSIAFFYLNKLVMSIVKK